MFQVNGFALMKDDSSAKYLYVFIEKKKISMEENILVKIVNGFYFIL